MPWLRPRRSSPYSRWRWLKPSVVPAQAGIQNPGLETMSSYEIIHHEYDVVVVGAGGAGLRATLGQIGRASCRERGVSVRVDLGGRRIIKKKKHITTSVTRHITKP